MSELPLPPVVKAASEVRLIDPSTARPSPRGLLAITDTSVAGLMSEISDVGQIYDVPAEIAEDGVIEIINGLRRAKSCQLLGKKLRVRIYNDLPRDKAIALAYRDNSQALPVSLWDRSCTWAQMVEDKVLKSEAELAKAVGVDKSTLSRGLAFQNAPKIVLSAFADVRQISLSQWMDIAPLLENEETSARIVERAALIAGKGYSAVRVATELKAAAANKDKFEKVDVKNRHGKQIATIQPNHRGGFSIAVKPMIEAHPTYRVEYAKAIHDEFVKLVKTWFDRETPGASS